MAATVALGWVMQGWFAADGTTMLEWVLLTLIAFNFFWITFTVSTVLLGLYSLSQTRPTPARGPRKPMRVALLVPVYNEVPWYVLGNARSMLEELRAISGSHQYDMFILSDTRDAEIAAQEEQSVRALRGELPEGISLYYRRREKNTARKVGNIHDWVTRWGGDYEAMLVLDADSLMTGRAIVRLTDALSRDPAAAASFRVSRNSLAHNPYLAACSSLQMASMVLHWPKGWRAGPGMKATTGGITPSSAPAPLPPAPACRNCRHSPVAPRSS